MAMRCSCPSSKLGGMFVLGAACFVGGVVASRALDAQPVTAEPASPFTGQTIHAAFQPEMDMDAMMAAMAEWSAPTEHHKLLEHMAGSFDCATEFSMGMPEPMTGTAVSEAQLVMGGRYVTQHFQMPDFMGMDFEGMGAIGYDKAKGKYVNVWIDNMSTGMMMMHGEYDKDTDTLVWKGEATYPGVDGAPTSVPVKHVVKNVTNGDTVMEFWEPNPMTGEMMKSGTIKYTRR